MSLAPAYSLVKPYLIFALTPIHAGVGRGFEEHVDLPVQRDNLGIPCIWGSSIKGALRTAFRQSNGKNKENIEKQIFGPERERGQEHAGALNVLDAKLFLAPMPSLKQGFVFVTSSLLLERACYVFELAGQTTYSEELRRLVKKLNSNGKTLVSNDKLVLENKIWLNDKVSEVDATPESINEVKTTFENILKEVSTPLTLETILDRIVILKDEDGLQLLSRATTSVTRIALDYSKKVVKEGALWDEEYVPETSMFVTAILMSNPRIQSEEIKNAEDLFQKLVSALKSKNAKDFYLVLGGHETIGKGVVKFCGW